MIALKVVDMNTSDRQVWNLVNFGVTVRDLKNAIAAIGKVSYEEQILIHRHILLHDHTITLNDFPSDETITLYRKSSTHLFCINVTRIDNGNIFPISLDGRETVATLKGHIDCLAGIPPARQILMANGAPMHHVDVIRDYWHTSEYTVLLAERARDPEVTFKVTIEDDEANDVGEIELETSDTVYTLMAVLRRQEWFAVTSGRGFRLRFGRTLLRGPQTMFELGIGHAAKIHMLF